MKTRNIKTLLAFFAVTTLLACNTNEKPEGAEIVMVDDVEIVMLEIPAATFTMGATQEQVDCDYYSEKPAHNVVLTKPFYISQTEVTQELWQKVMGNNPSQIKDEGKMPVFNVSWYDCQKFVKALSAKTGKKFRLPTEAEWEFAARGAGKGYSLPYAGSKFCDRVACMRDNSEGHPHPVGQYGANEAGLYDMSGNVWEWVADNFTEYKDSTYTDPLIVTEDSLPHSIRGGSWHDTASNCRTSTRSSIPADKKSNLIGFRIVMEK